MNLHKRYINWYQDQHKFYIHYKVRINFRNYRSEEDKILQDK